MDEKKLKCVLGLTTLPETIVRELLFRDDWTNSVFPEWLEEASEQEIAEWLFFILE